MIEDRRHDKMAHIDHGSAQHDKENDAKLFLPCMHEMYCIFHFDEPANGVYLCSVGSLCFKINTHFSVQCSSHSTITGNVA